MVFRLAFDARLHCHVLKLFALPYRVISLFFSPSLEGGVARPAKPSFGHSSDLVWATQIFVAASRHNFAKDSLGKEGGKRDRRCQFSSVTFWGFALHSPSLFSLCPFFSTQRKGNVQKKMLSPFSMLGLVVILIVVYWACQMRTSVPWPAWQPCQCLQACRRWWRERVG